jgi:hypothetical protein
MSVKNPQDLLVDYLYEELDAEQKKAFEDALQDSPDVREELEALQRTRELFAQLPELDVPRDITVSLIAAAHEAAPTSKPLSFFSKLRSLLGPLVLHPAMSAAAVMLVVLGISLYVYQVGPPSKVPEAPSVTAPAAAPAPAAAKTTLREGERKALGQLRQKARPMDNAGMQRAGIGNSNAPVGSGAFDQRKPQETWIKKESLSKKRAQRPKRLQSSQGSYSDAKKQPQQLGVRGQQQVAVTRNDKTMGLSRRRDSRAYRQMPVAKSAKRKRADVLKGGKLNNQVNSIDRDAENKRGAIAKTGKDAAQSKRKAQKQATAKPAPAKKPAARDWLADGKKEAEKGRCMAALDYFTVALRSNGALRGRIKALLGNCEATLRRSKKHRWLANRLHSVKRRHRKSRRKVPAQSEALE